MARRFVLLDRDGTLVVEKNYLSDPAELELIPGAAEGLRELSARGIGLLLITNQSAVGRGYFDLAQLERIHRRLVELLEAEGVRLDGIYFCPHHPDEGCACRKPATGLVERAAAEHGFDPARSFVVGDMASDIALGRALGASTVLVRSGYGAETERDPQAPRADHVVDDLSAAAAQILSLLGVGAGHGAPSDPMLRR